jgi:hypothetical protein
VVNLNTATPSTNFDINFHDTSNKQFSSFFYNTVINSAGASELDALIDMIFTKSQVVIRIYLPPIIPLFYLL